MVGVGRSFDDRTAALPHTGRQLRQLHVFLIKPTKYDDDGYLLRHVRGVLPSNTLATLHALTEDVRRRRSLGDIEVHSHLCDESVQRVPERRILRLARRRDTRVVVCLVGVQTNQFVRAADLARRFRAYGTTVMLGGFDVSGSLALIANVPPHLQELLDAGVTLVKGEVEETWASILHDVISGRLAPLYDSINDKPDLSVAPMPRLHPEVLRHFVYRHFGTVDTSRGCPFTCSFCTIINVQGRKMRFREASTIATAIEQNYRTTGTCHYFFTDDNFARSRNWRAILEEMIRLREDMGIPLRFLMQVDVLAHRIPDFVALAKRAGCFQVFVGMESLNPESLVAARKRQNKVADYAAMIETWHAAGILTHVGYIIGFPDDTPASIRENIRALKTEIRPDLAAFFMLTPLPGSEDDLKMLQAGRRPDDDLNRYDTFHPVVDHPQMSRQEWFDLYQQAWRQFYTVDHMQHQLAQLSGQQRTTLLQMYLWYKAAAFVENYHPMMTGFFRLKPRTDRRPGYAIESRLQHLCRRVPEMLAAIAGYGRILRELQQVWADTSPPRLREQLEPASTPTPARSPNHRGFVVQCLTDLYGLSRQVHPWTAFLREMFGTAPQQRVSDDRSALPALSVSRDSVATNRP